MSAGAVAGTRLSSIPRTAAQTRVITAALELFAEHGVSGTSLQMIADTIGVSKAAVYHQYNTKAEIVLATAETELVGLEAAVEAAEAQHDRVRAREMLLTHVISLAVTRRHLVSALQTDPVMVRLLAEHEPFRQLMDRLYSLLLGENPGPDTRVPTAMLSAAIAGAVSHPLLADVDDETLRVQLLYFARRLLDLPGR